MPTNTRIAPFLSVRRGRQAIEFYEAAFGAKVLFHIDGDDGAVVAQLSVDGAEFWVADESPEHKNFSPESLGGSTTRMLLVVDDRPQLGSGRAAGAAEVCPVSEQHGWRFGRVLDPFGHHWEIGKPTERNRIRFGYRGLRQLFRLRALTATELTSNRVTLALRKSLPG